MYKWVDANGQVHYGNQLPPEAAQTKREVIDKQGRTVKVYAAPLTPEEKSEEEHLAELKLKQRELAKKRMDHDRSLLATYSSEKDMYRARDAKVSAIESLIKATNSQISIMENRLLKLTDEAAGFERSGKQQPPSLLSQIFSLRKQIKRNREFVEDKTRETEDIKQQFDSDIRRYNELTSDRKTGKPATSQPSALEIAMNNPNVTLDRHDRTMLATYASEEDLVFARDQEARSINARISDTSNALDSMQAQLDELSSNASEYQDKNEIPPESLLTKMQQVIDKIDSTQATLTKQRLEKNKLMQQYATDISRYRELTATGPR